MKQKVKVCLVVIVCVFQLACSNRPAIPPLVNSLTAGNIPAATPGLDHYIAWVPLAQAQTASVAEAMTHISMQDAREKISQEYCRGEPITDGTVIEKHGPVATRMPDTMGAYPAWYYRISQQPGLQGCRPENTARLYQALQARLPAWISLSPSLSANTQTALTSSDQVLLTLKP